MLWEEERRDTFDSLWRNKCGCAANFPDFGIDRGIEDGDTEVTGKRMCEIQVQKSLIKRKDT
jgi:hypothetical protein